MPVVSEPQCKAMYAALNGHSTLGIPKAVAEKYVGPKAHDEEPEVTKRAAGIIFITPDEQVLLVERSPKGDHKGEYCFPGGMCEGDEEPEDTARREAIEEVSAPPGELKPFHRSVSDDGLEYTTFIQGVDKSFRPIINDESTRAIWRGLDDLPEPLHLGVASMLGLDMSEKEWDGLEEGLGKWIEEERQEDEHAEDVELANVTSEPKSPNPKAMPAGPGTEEGNGFAGSMGAGAGGGMDFGNDAKLSHTEVDYGPGKQKSHCSICEYYIKDGQSHCQLVADPIEPQGWCKLFTANQIYAVEVVRKYDGPWISCMSKDGERMYVNRNVPETVQIKDKLVNVDEDLLHHEVPEFNEIKRLLAEFEQEHARKPNTNEKKQIYLKAHNAAGTPSERQYCQEHGIDWDTLQAWFRGKESRIENLKVKNPPPDADVKPIPHKHGDLEIALDSKAEPEHTLEIQYDGDFDMIGFLRMLHLMGGHGSSRSINVDDEEDYSFSSLWDGDGPDKIHSAIIDGRDILKEGAEDAKFEEAKHPRKGGKFVKKGSGESGSKQNESKTENKTESAEKSNSTEKSGSHAQKVKAFLSQPNVAKIIANSAGSFLKEHAKGVSEEHVFGTYMGLIHTAVGLGIEHLGASVPEAAAVSIVGYTVLKLADKVGLGPKGVHALLIKTGKALISSLLGAHELGKAHPEESGDSALDAQPDPDVLASIQRFVKILEKTPTKELIKQAKAPKEDEVEDSADPRFDLRTRKLAEGKGVRVTGRIGGYEPYEEVASTKRTMARWLKEGREKIAGKSAQDEALWFALDQAVRASGGGEKYAFDRSVREYDADGRLHISVANISKANICPYLGKEIPDEDGTLNLEPDKVYQLLRPADELAKAASTFNGIPVLREHIPVSADDHQPDEVIGATGTDAEFVDPYLRNSLVIWSQDDIDLIKSGDKRSLSCAYRYVAEMSPGIYKGVKFDGSMKNIVANHLCVCVEGRAGDDVRIGDKVPEALRWRIIEEAILAA